MSWIPRKWLVYPKHSPWDFHQWQKITLFWDTRSIILFPQVVYFVIPGAAQSNCNFVINHHSSTNEKHHFWKVGMFQACSTLHSLHTSSYKKQTLSLLKAQKLHHQFDMFSGESNFISWGNYIYHLISTLFEDVSCYLSFSLCIKWWCYIAEIHQN